MPALPQQPNLPSEPAHTHYGEHDPHRELTDLLKWGQIFQRAFIQLWTSMVYVVNALCKVNTLANRTATPILDEIFYYASNTKQLFVGSAGAWENVAPRRSTATVANGGTSVAVALDPDEPDANYIVQLTAEDNLGAVWVTSKASTGFTINCSTAAGVGGDVVAWTLWRTSSG